MDTVHIDLVGPRHRAGWFGVELARWLLAVASGVPGVRLRPVGVPTAARDRHRGATASSGTVDVPDGAAAAPAVPRARVLVVRDDRRVPPVALAGTAPLPVALVAYGGRARGGPALARAREVLGRAGVPTPLPSLGFNAAAVREAGFAEADALLWSLLLDELRDAAAVSA